MEKTSSDISNEASQTSGTSPNAAESNKKPASLTISNLFAFRVISLSLLWSWSLTVIFSDVCQAHTFFRGSTDMLYRGIGILAISLTLFFIMLSGSRKSENGHNPYIVVAITIICAPWVSLFALTYNMLPSAVQDLEFIPWILFGIADGALMFIALPLPLEKKPLRKLIFEVGISFVIGSLLYLVFAYFPVKYVAQIIVTALPYLMLLSLRGCKQYEVLADFSKTNKPVSCFKAIKASLSTQATQLVFGIVFGISLYVGILEASLQNNTFPVYIACAFFLSSPILMILVRHLNHYAIDISQWLLSPILVGGLLFLILNIPLVTAICCTALAFCYNFYGQAHTARLAESMREAPDEAISVWNAGKFLFYLGLATGWLLVWVFELTTGYSTQLFQTAIIVVSLVIIITLCVSAKPTLSTSVTPNLPEPDVRTNVDAIIAEMAEAAEMTPRQTEVFTFLAKGRNAPYISEELFLSYHTVKSHIYRIYQKLDVHTQQELIDKIEAKVRNKKS